MMSRCFRPKTKSSILPAMALLLWLGFLGFAFVSAAPLGYEPPKHQTSAKAVLFFQYMDSAFLGYEIREIPVPYTDSPEKSMVQALLDGPGPAASQLKPLFPAGTRVLSVTEEGNKLFITFNDAFLSPMPGESGIVGRAVSQPEKRRRQLALSSLVNTLTQNGTYREVQVLVVTQSTTSTSLRLSMRYFLEDSDAIPDPLLRDETRIISPGKAAELFLADWQSQNQAAFLKKLSMDDHATNGDAFSVQNLPTLISWQVSPGQTIPTSSTSTITLTLDLTGSQGEERHLISYPLKLIYEDGIWKVSLASLLRILGDAQ